jgi:hypothetical protein
MSNPELPSNYEEDEELTPASLFGRFEAVGKKLEAIREGSPVVGDDDSVIEDKFILQSGEEAYVYWVECPQLDRESELLYSGSIITGGGPNTEDSTWYDFSRKLGDIDQPNAAVITTDEEVTDGDTKWQEDRDLSEETEALITIDSLLYEIEQSVDYRLANPLESIPVADS